MDRIFNHSNRWYYKFSANTVKMNQKTLQINGICKQYGYINILKDIDIKLSDGNILTLVGPNGAGKSTLLKILSTQVRPTKGEIFYNNIPVYKELNIYRKKLAFLSHKTFLYDDLSAYQNLLFLQDYIILMILIKKYWNF